MPRSMTANMVAAISSATLAPALLVQMNFANANVNVWSGLGNLTWNGNTFAGLGDLGSISTISEDSTVEAKNVTLELSGVPISSISDPTMQDIYQTLYDMRVLQPCWIYLALRNANGSIISNPILSYHGMMDKGSVRVDGSTASITINLENILVDLNRPCWRRYTNDDQKMDMPYLTAKYGLSANTIDNAFQFVPTIQEQITFWGSKPASVNNI